MKKLLSLLLILTLLIPASADAIGGDMTKGKTVYFTLANDGVPVMGNDSDQTVLSHVKVTVPYFDLQEYGLQDFYRYPRRALKTAAIISAIRLSKARRCCICTCICLKSITWVWTIRNAARAISIWTPSKW